MTNIKIFFDFPMLLFKKVFLKTNFLKCCHKIRLFEILKNQKSTFKRIEIAISLFLELLETLYVPTENKDKFNCYYSET